MRCSVAESNRKVGGDAHIDRVVDATAKVLVGADGNEVLIETHRHRTYRVVRPTPQDSSSLSAQLEKIAVADQELSRVDFRAVGRQRWGTLPATVLFGYDRD